MEAARELLRAGDGGKDGDAEERARKHLMLAIQPGNLGSLHSEPLPAPTWLGVDALAALNQRLGSRADPSRLHT